MKSKDHEFLRTYVDEISTAFVAAKILVQSWMISKLSQESLIDFIDAVWKNEECGENLEEGLEAPQSPIKD
jgi:hypothetical protein